MQKNKLFMMIDLKVKAVCVEWDCCFKGTGSQ